MRIGIASDHRGYEVKKRLIEILSKKYDVIDYGTNSSDSCDYPVYVYRMCEDKKSFDFGVVLCGTGIGVSIAANKVRGIRCARVVNLEETKLARQHNNANVVALSADNDINNIIEIIDTFVNTEFSNEERHIRRNNMLDNYEC